MGGLRRLELVELSLKKLSVETAIEQQETCIVTSVRNGLKRGKYFLTHVDAVMIWVSIEKGKRRLDSVFCPFIYIVIG